MRYSPTLFFVSKKRVSISAARLSLYFVVSPFGVKLFFTELILCVSQRCRFPDGDFKTLPLPGGSLFGRTIAAVPGIAAAALIRSNPCPLPHKHKSSPGRAAKNFLKFLKIFFKNAVFSRSNRIFRLKIFPLVRAYILKTQTASRLECPS